MTDFLAKQNNHTRDERIQFDDPTHTYTIDGDSSYISVTTWNHKHFKPFDADKIIANMKRSRNWSNSKYYGMTDKEIKDSWEKNRDEAATSGTKMHYDIECYYNNMNVENDSTEYQYFIDFKNDHPNLKPYRTEWTVFDEDLKMAGSIDMVYENNDGTLSIYDWKRSKQIKKTNPFGSSINKLIDHIPDSNYWHYSLQLNTYKAILERKYGKTVTDLYLVCLHPNNKKYQKIKVADLSKEINLLFDERFRKVSQ